MIPRKIHAPVVALVLAASGLLLVPFVEWSGVNRGRINVYSAAEERRLGEYAARRLEVQARLVTLPPVLAYLQRLGTTIAAAAGTPEIRYEFRMLDTPVVNALSLPGGFVYVTSGLMLAIDNEAQLAGVLAHEIAHVAAHHGAQQLSRDQLVSFLTSLGDAVFGGLASPLPALVTNLESQSYSRGDEVQADDLATGYLYRARYHPEGLATFFDLVWRLSKETRLERFLSSHPLSADRATRVRARIAAWVLDERWVRNSTAFREVQELLRARSGAPQTGARGGG